MGKPKKKTILVQGKDAMDLARVLELKNEKDCLRQNVYLHVRWVTKWDPRKGSGIPTLLVTFEGD